MDFQKQPFMGSDEFSIKRKPVKTLEETLNLMTKKQLEGILDSYNPPKPYSFIQTKGDLVKVLKKVILENCVRFFFYEEEVMWQTFEAFCQKRNSITGVSEMELYIPENLNDEGDTILFIFQQSVLHHFMRQGLLFHYSTRSGYEYFVIPNEIYKEISEYKEADKNFGKWFGIKYFSKILLSVYGVLTAEDFKTLWEILFPERKLTVKQIYEHFKFSAVCDDDSYKWHENLLVISDDFLDDMDVLHLLKVRKRHSFFIPGKKVLEHWFQESLNPESEDIHNEYDQLEVEYQNPFYIQMSDFLKKVRKKQEDWGEVLYRLMLNIKLGLFPSQSYTVLDEDFELTEKMSMKETEKFINIYMRLHNSTHIWTSYGWSPDELSDLLNGKDRIRFSDLLPISFSQSTPESETHTFPKVGRNDPCPCGSGKKYKHCHGK